MPYVQDKFKTLTYIPLVQKVTGICHFNEPLRYYIIKYICFRGWYNTVSRLHVAQSVRWFVHITFENQLGLGASWELYNVVFNWAKSLPAFLDWLTHSLCKIHFLICHILTQNIVTIMSPKYFQVPTRQNKYFGDLKWLYYESKCVKSFVSKWANSEISSADLFYKHVTHVHQRKI